MFTTLSFWSIHDQVVCGGKCQGQVRGGATPLSMAGTCAHGAQVHRRMGVQKHPSPSGCWQSRSRASRGIFGISKPSLPQHSFFPNCVCFVLQIPLFFKKMIDFRERKREKNKRWRGRETLVCCPTYLCIY